MQRVRAERVGNRIHLRTPYLSDPDAWADQLNQLKSIPGARWAPGAKRWTYPLDLGACRRMRAVFGDRLELGPEVTTWGRAELERERALRTTLDLDPRRPAELRQIPTLAPTMHAAMLSRGYQTVAAQFGAIAGPHGNFDDPGLGKCIESLGALIEGGHFGKGLLIAPRTALNVTWAPEIEKWMNDVPGDVLVRLANVQPLPRRPGRVRPATAEERAEAIEDFLAEADDYSYAFLLVNPQMLNTTKSFKCSWMKDDRCKGEHCPNLRNHKLVLNHAFPKLHTTQWDFLIGDEAHLYSLHGRQKKPTMVGLGFHSLQAKPIPQSEDGMRIALTGTALKGKPTNLWASLAWIKPSVYSSRWNFAQSYYASKPNLYTHSGVEYLEEIRRDRMKDLDRELSRIVIRRTSSELRGLNPAWAPPPIQYVEKWADLTPGQANLYDQMEKDASARFGGRVLTADNILAQMTRLKQFASAEYKMQDGELVVCGDGGKFEWLVESFLPKLGITGSKESEDGSAKVVIASQFTKHVNRWRQTLLHMGIECFILTGETSDDERAVQQQRFLKPGGPRVFLINTTAGGLSITLDSADYGVLMDETWVPDDQDQVEKRIHRTSNVEHSVTWYYVRSRGTIEEDIANDNEDKRDRDKTIMDGRRGVAWAQKHWRVDTKNKRKRRNAA
jgi:SNF2 family DNA or RNA helicase